GAYYAYRAVADRLAADRAINAPQLALLENYEIRIAPYKAGDIAARILYLSDRPADVAPILEPKPQLPSPIMTQPGNWPAFRNSDGRGRLVINGDSFAGTIAEFLARHFEETAVFDSFQPRAAFDGELVRRLRADVFIAEIAERFLPLLAFPPRDLDKACAS